MGNSPEHYFKTQKAISKIIGVILNGDFIQSHIRYTINTKRVHLGLCKVSFIEGCPHVRGGLYEGFHCIVQRPTCTVWHNLKSGL